MVNLTSRNEKTLVMADKGFDLVVEKGCNYNYPFKQLSSIAKIEAVVRNERRSISLRAV
jgi:hypothetical protein